MILLDRHGPVWAVAESKRLSRAAAIRKAQTEDGLEGVTVKPLTAEIAALATQFPDDYPRDPADRLIGATARAEG